MIRLFAFISIVSLITKPGNDSDTSEKFGQDSHFQTYHQFLLQANHVSGDSVNYALLDVDYFVMMDYGHCSQCAKVVLEFMAGAANAGFKISMIHYGGQESFASNRATRNKYKFEYPYLKDVYFSPVNLPDKSKVPIIALPRFDKFIIYDEFNEANKLLLMTYKQ